MDERLAKLLKDPKYKELVEMIDTIIVFENGEYKESIRRSEIGRKAKR